MKRIYSVILVFLTITSCSNDQSNVSVVSNDSTAFIDTVHSAMMDTVSHPVQVSLSLLKELPENERTFNFDSAYFDDYNNIEKIKSSARKVLCSSAALPDGISCSDTVYFSWKMSYEKFVLISLMTIDWNAKGPSTVFHLITVDAKTGKMIDSFPDWVGSYAVAIENPNGGTSAGVEYTLGNLEVNPVVTISNLPRESDSDIYTFYELSSEGNFVAPYARLEAETDLQ